MFILQVQWLAVVVAAVAALVVGSLWYGPLFGKKYITAMGWDNIDPAKKEQMKKGMVMMYVWQFLASLVMFYVLDVLVNTLGAVGAMEGIKVALVAWVGFILTIKLGDSLWGGKKTLFWLSAGNTLVTMVVAGAILGAWR